MYGLPASTDLEFIRGLALTQVCVSEHQVVLELGESTEISVTSDLAVGVGAGRSTQRSSVVEELVSSIGRAVVHIEWDPTGTIVLQFEGREARIFFQDDDPNFECYQVYVDGVPRIVV